MGAFYLDCQIIHLTASSHTVLCILNILWPRHGSPNRYIRCIGLFLSCGTNNVLVRRIARNGQISAKIGSVQGSEVQKWTEHKNGGQYRSIGYWKTKCRPAHDKWSATKSMFLHVGGVPNEDSWVNKLLICNRTRHVNHQGTGVLFKKQWLLCGTRKFSSIYFILTACTIGSR